LIKDWLEGFKLEGVYKLEDGLIREEGIDRKI
jgi:hypothetical protein